MYSNNSSSERAAEWDWHFSFCRSSRACLSFFRYTGAAGDLQSPYPGLCSYGSFRAFCPYRAYSSKGIFEERWLIRIFTKLFSSFEQSQWEKVYRSFATPPFRAFSTECAGYWNTSGNTLIIYNFFQKTGLMKKIFFCTPFFCRDIFWNRPIRIEISDRGKMMCWKI